VRSATRVLSAAFETDPLMRCMFPHPRRRAFASRGFFRGILRDALPFRETHVVAVDGAIVGVSAWLPPGAYPLGAAREAKMITTSLGAVLEWSTLANALRYLRAIPLAHPKTRHAYLAVVGVHPSWHGRGIGHRLLDPVHDELDATGDGAYLETQTVANVAWYSRQGYAIVEELEPIPDGPPLWTMWREPDLERE
jgi:ribosomal protein S18 acetylase RimI-like enzyme